MCTGDKVINRPSLPHQTYLALAVSHQTTLDKFPCPSQSSLFCDPRPRTEKDTPQGEHVENTQFLAPSSLAQPQSPRPCPPEC